MLTKAQRKKLNCDGIEIWFSGPDRIIEFNIHNLKPSEVALMGAKLLETALLLHGPTALTEKPKKVKPHAKGRRQHTK